MGTAQIIFMMGKSQLHYTAIYLIIISVTSRAVFCAICPERAVPGNISMMNSAGTFWEPLVRDSRLALRDFSMIMR